jgi:hypothetical protein
MRYQYIFIYNRELDYTRFEVLTAVKITTLVFASIFRAEEDGDSMFLQNVGIYLQVHTALQPRTTSIIRNDTLSIWRPPSEASTFAKLGSAC